MCGGVRYVDSNGKDWKIYFPNPKAALPISRDGSIEWVKWGRRKDESEGLGFVQGGWARSDSIQAGKWNRFHPQPIELAVISFMEKDEQRTSHWIDLNPGQVIEALLIQIGEEKRIYVVTEETPPEYSWVHDRWPKIIQEGQVPDLRI